MDVNHIDIILDILVLVVDGIMRLAFCATRKYSTTWLQTVVPLPCRTQFINDKYILRHFVLELFVKPLVSVLFWRLKRLNLTERLLKFNV